MKPLEKNSCNSKNILPASIIKLVIFWDHFLYNRFSSLAMVFSARKDRNKG